MYVPLVSSSRERKVSKHLRIYWLFSLLLISTSQLCWADSTSSGKDNGIASLLDKASLGDYADIEVPQGFRFIGADDARAMLERNNNPVDPGLLGVLTPTDGKWLAVLEFEQGYLKDPNTKLFDSGAILKAVQNRHENKDALPLNGGAARVASVQWDIEPKYDASAHSLEWAFQADTPSGKVVNHTVALLGRRGVLQITVVQPYKVSQGRMDSAPLKEFVKSITFKEGQRYTDYQEGDKVASIGIQRVIVGEDEAPASRQDDVAAASPVPGVETWIFTTLGGCLALGICLLAYMKLRKPKTTSTISATSATPAVATNGHALPDLQPNGKTNGKTNGTKNGAQKRNGTVRKHKDFNYSKYYSDMVLQLSGTSYHWVSPTQNTHARGVVAASPQPAPPQSIADASMEVIACQKNLIEEQRNLMREQTRIIEEKARLIKEYTQLVERLSQDVDSQFSLKLD